MELTDQELFYILQVKSPAKPMPWENITDSPLGRDWAEWAKREVLSGKGGGSARGMDLDSCCIYVARLVRVLETVAENGGMDTRRREDGAFVFEKSTLKTVLSDGLEACGCPVCTHTDFLFLATHNGLLSEHEYDDWRPGMASGTGCRMYYGLTFKGKRQAEKASMAQSVGDKEGEAKGKGEASSLGPASRGAKHDEHDTPATGVTEILELCRARPNEAFLYWKALEQEVAQCASGEDEHQCKDRATLGAFRGWFEECGHWRDLKPSAEDSGPADRELHAENKKLMEDFVAVRRARLQVVEYDEFHADHTDRSEGTESARTEYRWTYLLAGEPQLILTFDDYQAQYDRPRTRYLRKARPYGYAYSVAADIGRTCVEGCAYFRSGMYLEFICDFGGDIYPRQPGDYELCEVGKNEKGFEALHADVRVIKQSTSPLPEAIRNVGKGVETALRHVRGVPILQADLAEALVVPEALALEVLNRIADILTVEEQAIWRAVRNAGGIQKDALPSLRQSAVVNSAATLSRRVAEIDGKLLENRLPPCAAAGPAIRFTKSGGYQNNDGKAVPEELSPVEQDWANDPGDRDTTIQAYLGAADGDKAFFEQTKPGIAEEAKKYLKRRSMKFD